MSDTAAAEAAGIASIGYANKPGALATAGARVIIERITALAAAPAPAR